MLISHMHSPHNVTHSTSILTLLPRVLYGGYYFPGRDDTGRDGPVPATNFRDGSIELALFPGPHGERGYDVTQAAS